MKLYYCKHIDRYGVPIAESTFYAKSRDTMRVKIAHMDVYAGREVSVYETDEKPTYEYIEYNGKPLKVGVKLKKMPAYIGSIYADKASSPLWKDAKGEVYNFYKSTGKLYKKRRS